MECGAERWYLKKKLNITQPCGMLKRNKPKKPTKQKKPKKNKKTPKKQTPKTKKKKKKNKQFRNTIAFDHVFITKQTNETQLQLYSTQKYGYNYILLLLKKKQTSIFLIQPQTSLYFSALGLLQNCVLPF